MNIYSQFKQSLRQAKGEVEFQKMMNDEIKKALEQNKFGCICLKASKLDLAEKHLKLSLQMLNEILKCPVTNILMNLGNLNAERRQKEVAVEFYRQVIHLSPYANEEEHKGIVWSNKLNSFEAYVDAHTNLACLLVNLDQTEEAYIYCLKAIELNPDNFDAQTNFGDLLRQLGRQQEAIEHTWKLIDKYTKQEDPNYKLPEKINVKKVQQQDHQVHDDVNIICMKWGTKYGADYVNKLYNGFKKYTTRQFNFICVTDDPKDLQEQIQVRELQKGWTGWWGKATLFMDYKYPPGRLFFIDLDMIVTGNMDQILNYKGSFGILRTDEIACEKQNKNGYNSSIMVWNDREHFQRVFTELDKNWKTISKFIVRFDFWLEMMIENADYLQDLYPTQISDFVMECSNHLPENTRVVCFPRMPKPEHYPAEWIKQYWL